MQSEAGNAARRHNLVTFATAAPATLAGCMHDPGGIRDKAITGLLATVLLALPASAKTIKAVTCSIETPVDCQGNGRNPRYARDYLRLREDTRRRRTLTFSHFRQ
ncbi:MAG: hypothetical protein F4053_04295 [Proteobacteria bacterium]|nr:hypothetical protein [Pseudomonadota bacterium]